MPDERARQDLRTALEQGLITVVVGTGVSMAATSGAATASWIGLMESGLARALDMGTSRELAESIRKDLELGAHEPTCLWTAAEKITNALGGVQSANLAEWLRDDIGALRPASSEIINAINDLGCSIATTNYDDLIEQITGRGSVTWREAPKVQRAVRQESDDVVHLHGIWKDPESIVFGGLSYGRLAADEAAQALQRALITLRSFLFIGCGGGLNDPNFGPLREWVSETLHGRGARHFRLCIADESAALRADGSDDRITPIVYGERHEDLVPFLRSLVQEDASASTASASPSPAPAAIAAARAFEALCEHVRGASVLGDEMRDVDSRSLDKLLVPPVLLPVSHEQFVTARRDVLAERCDPTADAATNGVLLVVAEENAGLTSTLEWLVAERWRQEAAVVPVVVNFRSVGAGHDPMRKQIVRELMAAGAMSDVRHDPPTCALGIDNLMTQPGSTVEVASFGMS